MLMPPADVSRHMLAWALAWGAPPEVACALVAHALPPLPGGADALLRAVAALQLEARDHAGTARGASAEVASRLVLGIAAYHLTHAGHSAPSTPAPTEAPASVGGPRRL